MYVRVTLLYHICMKKVIAFDLDDTLADSKTAITDEMSELISKLLHKYEVCVISGGTWTQFENQLLGNLHVESHLYSKLHLMPTCGTRYYRYEDIKKQWHKIYSEDLAEDERKKIVDALQSSAEELGLIEEKTWGDIIEDRMSQVTFSALGQQAPPEEKKKWDPDRSKKIKLRDLVAQKIPEFEVRAGGSTSIDVTKPGIDKAFGMERLMQALEISKDDILFVGDNLQEGGNDYPVKALGINSISVEGHEETPLVIQTILGMST